MPTKNPRITVTLTPAVHAVLRRLATLTENSQSAIIGDLLSETLPIFERMTEMLEAALALKGQAKKVPDEITASLDLAQQRIEAQLGIAFEQMGTASQSLLAEAEKVNRRSAGGRTGGTRSGTHGGPAKQPAAASTPISNRGVTPLLNPKKSSKQRPSKGGRHGAV